MKTEIVGDEVEIRGYCGVGRLRVRDQLVLNNPNLSLSSLGDLTVSGLVKINGTKQYIHTGLIGAHPVSNELAIGSNYSSDGAPNAQPGGATRLNFAEGATYFIDLAINVRVSENLGGKVIEVFPAVDPGNELSYTETVHPKLTVASVHSSSGNFSSIDFVYRRKVVAGSGFTNLRFTLKEYGSATLLTPVLTQCVGTVWRLA